MFSIREATASDAEGICHVIVKAIQSCEADHENQQDLIEKWCVSKTKDNVLIWITNPRNITIIATNNDNLITGVALLDKEAQRLRLCYVLPQAHGQGLGKTLLKNIENKAKDAGIVEMNLSSTKTARGFYQRNGYSGSLPVYNQITGRSNYDMKKSLSETIEDSVMVTKGS
ncbi:MAG: family N-acetyltransferase [Gammaproteobacteria bacterium]|jgi:N-acetylglutamate synthase-like GNAT family acetyltransferase|nr:family N-acetyltransferase [Gammaproteobacteria bacterium]